MTTAPAVSVVMSVHNGLPFLGQAVESILGQTYPNLEFVVVDDSSTDATWETLLTFARRDSRLVLLQNESNLGVARSRNKGIQISRGAYIACQDADDISLPERVARQAEFLDANPHIGLVGAWPQFVDDRGDHLNNANYPLLADNEQLQQQLLDSNCFCAGTIMMRRRWLDVVGVYDQALAPSEDYDLWLRLAEVTQLANLPEVLYHYRQHSSSASNTRRYIQMHNKAIALERALTRRYESTPPRDLKMLVARDYLRAATIGFVSDEREGAQASFERAMTFAPDLGHSGNLVEDVLVRYLLKQSVPDPYTLIEAMFAGLFPHTSHLARVKSRILSRLHMREVFEAAHQGQPDRVRQHWWVGIKNDPRWLLNRGVLSISLKHLFGFR